MKALGDILSILPIGIGLLAILMTIDLVTAIVRCAITGTVLSRRLTWGVAIKSGILLVVTMAFGADVVIARFIPSAKQYVAVMIGQIVTAWYMLGELISILENLAKMGVPLPKFLIRILAVARHELVQQTRFDKTSGLDNDNSESKG
jgi:phage-related holin